MLVSVITPSYNRADTLPRAAQSVFAQTYNEIEYIIVNDGSTDETDRVVEQFNYPDLKYIKLDENHGVSTARNEGIKAANGRFVLFVDSDDELRESAVSTLVEELCTAPEDCAGVFGRDIYYRDAGEVRRSTCDSSEVGYDDLIEKNHMGAFGGKLIRRRLFEKVGRLDPTLPSSEDFDFFLRVAANGYYFKFIDESTYIKYLHDDQLYANTPEKITGMRGILRKHGDELTPQHRAYRMRVIGDTYAKTDHIAEACTWFKNSITQHPTKLDYYVKWILSKLRIYNVAADFLSFIRKSRG